MRARVLLLSGFFIAAGVLAYAFIAEDGYRGTVHLEEEKAALKARVGIMEADNAALAEEAKALQDTEEGNPVLEQAVRSELGYVKKDEVIVLTDGEP